MAVNKMIKKAKKLEEKAAENLNAEVRNGSTKDVTNIKKGNIVDPSQKHKDYIERAILESVNEWLAENELRSKVVKL